MNQPKRQHCIIPFCQCTRSQGVWEEWICRKHWYMVDFRKRRAYARLKRLEAASGDLRWSAARARIWRRASREAIERAIENQ